MIKYKIPYAVSNYEALRLEGYYYVDKTKYITELEQYKVPVFLRPRRFGKSLLCTTLESYYDLNKADRFEAIFGDTYIGKNPTGRQSSHMVMSLDFSAVSVTLDMDEMARNFDNIINRTIRGFATTVYKPYFTDFHFTNTNTAADLLNDILVYIQQNNLPKLYLIIDKYDNFTNQFITTHHDKEYEDLTTGNSFLRTFFKVIKEGVKDNSIASVFITGVLPITMDDLTSGFNIAQMVTIEPRRTGMLGFTHEEVDRYLENIFESYEFDRTMLPEIRRIIESNYDGYRFLPDAELIYNSTILSYFLNSFTINDATVPRVLIDENLRTDVNWIKRLTLGVDNAKEMLEKFVYDGMLPYNSEYLVSQFNRKQFFQKDFYPISLYYLGMATPINSYEMKLPNNTMRTIFIDYYNTLNDLRGTADKYIGIFQEFLKTFSMETLFAGYYREYLGQFVAQAFDKINENFVRNTFYELCTRYLSQAYTFAIEQNYPSGRCDYEITGRPQTQWHTQKQIVEFKYYTQKECPKIKRLTAPFPEDAEQVCRYAADIMEQFPYMKVRRHVIYVMANKGFRYWEV